MTDIPDVYICLICKTPIEWEGTDDHRGSIWSCEKCGETFCRQCFIDAHDAEAFRSMVNNDDVVTCPHCYGEAHNRKISSRMQAEDIPRSLILEALTAKKTGACQTQWLQGENLRALLMQLRSTILSPHVETKMESGRYFELYKQRKSAPEIVVTLYGGLIQAVHSTNPYTKVYIADSDILENGPGDDEVAALDYAQDRRKMDDMHDVY